VWIGKGSTNLYLTGVGVTLLTIGSDGGSALDMGVNRNGWGITRKEGMGNA
jgi:hypothetical protein